MFDGVCKKKRHGRLLNALRTALENGQEDSKILWGRLASGAGQNIGAVSEDDGMATTVYHVMSFEDWGGNAIWESAMLLARLDNF